MDTCTDCNRETCLYNDEIHSTPICCATYLRVLDVPCHHPDHIPEPSGSLALTIREGQAVLGQQLGEKLVV